MNRVLSKQKTFLAILLLSFSGSSLAIQQSSRDVSKETARPVRDWVRDGVIYEIYPRAFSQQGNFNAITARLVLMRSAITTRLILTTALPQT